MKKTISFILVSIIISSVSAQMTLKLIKTGYYTDNINTYYVITSFHTTHPSMFPSKRPEIEIINNEETIGEFPNFDPRGILITWDNFNESLSFYGHFQNMRGLASTIAVKIPNFIIESPNEFEIINDYYARYKKRIFYHHFEIKEVDFSSFKIIDHIHSKDKNSVFLSGRKILGSNPSHFKVINEVYSKDNRHVYFKGEILVNASSNTFQSLGYFYQKDDNSVWDHQGCLIDADTDTFKPLKVLKENSYDGIYYAIDKDNVYYEGGNILTLADPKTFKVVSSARSPFYGVDANSVYVGGEIINGADSKTFKVVPEKNEDLKYDAYDKKHQYRNGIKLSPAKNKKH